MPVAKRTTPPVNGTNGQPSANGAPINTGTPLKGLQARLNACKLLLGMLAPLPPAWLVGATGGVTAGGTNGGYMECAPCSTWQHMINAWRKALKWTQGLDDSLSVMLASVTSTKAVGDQLWVKVLGPASCGKSTLCEAISVNNKYIVAKSTIRGFHTGFKTPDGKDHSLIAKVAGKTLITKDGDTLLKAPNLGEILAEARDVYDSVSRTHYRNASSKDYAGIRMTWILSGTNSLRLIDQSELGERFLDCVVMDSIDDDLEDEVILRVANRSDRNLGIEASGSIEAQYEPELAQAMQLTGGYVNYLRQHATELLGATVADQPTLKRCGRLGKFVAYMRARPSKVQDEDSGREVAYRLVSQHVRLAKCLAVVLNRPTVDKEVMRRVTKVAMDTSRGATLELVELLVDAPQGLEVKALSLCTNRTEPALRTMLRFLKRIGVTQTVYEPTGHNKRSNVAKWVLTPRVFKLYAQVTASAVHVPE